MTTNDILTQREAAELLGVTRQMLYLYSKQGVLNPMRPRVGVGTFYSRVEVEKLQAARTELVPAKPARKRR